MTRLTLDLRNLLVQTPEIKTMVENKIIGKGVAFSDGWVFDTKPYANIEKKSYQALIVITHDGTWQAPNEHNTARFPRILVDIWASPTRKADGSPVIDDADYLIEDVMKSIRPYLHTVNMDVSEDGFQGPAGYPRVWGTPEQIQSRTGSLIFFSQSLGEPQFNDVKDGNGARMGRFAFGVATA
jgi:hypothetical protein